MKSTSVKPLEPGGCKLGGVATASRASQNAVLKIEGNWIIGVYENDSKMTSSTRNASLGTANPEVHGSFAWKRFMEGEMATMQQHNIFRPFG
jgi:hypothetical protein